MARGSWFDDPDDPHEALAIAERFHGEWHNGGLAQFFANWEPEDASLVPVALRIIGCPQAAAIVERAVATMGPPARWKESGLDVLIGRNDLLRDAVAQFDRELDPHEPALDKAMVDFEYQLAKSSGEEMFE